MTVAVGTIVADNYLPFARVLASSLSDRHPGVPFFVLLCGEGSSEEFDVLSLDQVGVPDLDAFLARYDRQQVVVSTKPFLMRHLLDRGFDRVVFIDADALVLGDLSTVLRSTAPITLVPHHLHPLDDPERELAVLQAGVYNGGVVGASATPEARRFLDWWAERLTHHCRHDREAGLHFDQRWLDLVPSFFEGVEILRDPAIDVAYWNLPERRDVAPALFHFSGFDPDEPDKVSWHAPELRMAHVGPTAEVFRRYADLLADAGRR